MSFNKKKDIPYFEKTHLINSVHIYFVFLYFFLILCSGLGSRDRDAIFTGLTEGVEGRSMTR